MINSKLATFNDRVDSLEAFRKSYENNRLEYQKFARSHIPKIVNYSFNHYSREQLGEDTVEKIRLVQADAQSPFLFEYEKNSNQDTDSLLRQLEHAGLWLEEKESTKTIVPVVDMGMDEEGLFLEKLQSLSNYKRINVVYRSVSEAPNNWADLKNFLQHNTTWCHIDCIPTRFKSEIAHRVRLYAYGISSTSLGCTPKMRISSDPKEYIFNAGTHRFVATSPPLGKMSAQEQDANWATSLNGELAELQNMRNHTIGKTLYEKYIPSTDTDYLRFTKRI